MADVTISPANKYEAIKMLDCNMVDYEQYENDQGQLVISINEPDDVKEKMIENKLIEDIKTKKLFSKN